MRGLLAATALAVCAVVIGASTAEAATCTDAQKRKNQAALAKFKRGMVAARGVYFRAHKSPSARAAFLRRQRAKLKTLEKRAACRAQAATCTSAQKRKNQAALAKFKRGMVAARRVYFRGHKSPTARAAFLRRQRAKLKTLEKRAACRVPTRQPPPPPPPPLPPPLADLAVSMSASTATAGIHAPVTYTVVVQNLGIAVARSVVLTDPLGPALQRIEATHGCSGLATVACALGDINPGGARTLRIVARPMQAGAVANTASASSPDPDRFNGNNSASTVVSVASLPTYETPPGPGYSLQLERPPWADDQSQNPWVGEWPKTPGVFHPGVGALRGAVLYVDFPDAAGAASAFQPEEATALLGTSARAWYAEASYGRFDLQLTTIPGWHRMSKPVAEYGIARCCSPPNVRAFVEEAIARADASFDFSTFDALWVIGPSGASEQMSILIDQRWPGQGITVDGRELRRWITAPAAYPSVPTQVDPALFSHWAVTHELGHFLGLPDLYLKPCPTCTNTFEPAGYWDLMSHTPLHAHFLAWHKWLLGWIDPAQIRGLTAPGSVETTLAPLAAPGGVKAVVVPLTPSTAYVVEARVPMGWESGLCDQGVLVYTVDSMKSNAQGSVHIKPAHPSQDSPCGPIAQAAFDVGPGEVATFEDPDNGVRVDVLERMPDASYRVRVTKSP